MVYTLFKNPIQLDTHRVVKYLQLQGHELSPTYILERNHPDWVSALPSIETDTKEKFIGWDACVEFWERETGVQGLGYMRDEGSAHFLLRA